MLVPGRDPSKGLDALDLFSRMDIPTPGAMTTAPSPERRESFRQALNAALDQSLDNPSRLHGWRVQGLFEAMIVSLGSVRLIKEEDTGSYFYDDATKARPADFRVITDAGEHLLVEVKGVKPSDKTRPQRIRDQDVAPLVRYAELTGARLLFAHYWSAVNMWSLVDAATLKRHDKRKLALDFPSAMMANELGLLGDAQIGIEPPLTLSLVACRQDQHLKRHGKFSEFRFKIASVEFANAGRALTDPQQQKIAWFLMLHGQWLATEEAVGSAARVGDSGSHAA